MINAILKSFGLIARNPLLLLPALLAGIINSIIIELLRQNLVELLADWSSQGFLPVSGIQEPFYFIALHLNQFLLAGVGLFLVAVVNGITVFAYAEYVREKTQESAGVLKAMINSWKAIPRILILVGFLSIIALMFAVFFSYSIALSAGLEILGLILAIIVLLLGLYLAIHFAFSLTVLGFEQMNVKETLKKTWNFSSKNSIQVIIFLALLTIIPIIFVEIGLYISSLIQNEIILTLIPLIITLIVFSFSNLSFALFYNEKSTQ